MKRKKIIDNPSIQKNLKDINGLRAIKTLLPLAKPFLVPLGVDYKGLKSAFAGLEDVAIKMDNLATLPDRFNELFSDIGWIMYDGMNVDAAEKAIEIAKNNGLEAADSYLADHYSYEEIQWRLRTMFGVKAFYDRMPLAECALEDYKHERYHACVPVVLMLLDGLVNQVGKQNRGFFAEGADCSAWDSIAAHDEGLNKISSIFRKSRKKTTTEEIHIPFRNGILHGMDLGYGNKVVAAKCWSTLFAAREWAIKAENNQINEPPKQEETSWLELLRQLRKTDELKRRLEEWKPRHNITCAEIPTNAKPGYFNDQLPEHTLAKYLELWQNKNYGNMSRLIHNWGDTINPVTPAQVRQEYYDKMLTSYNMTSISDIAAAITVIDTHLTYVNGAESISKEISFRLICIDSTGEIQTRGETDAKWNIISWCIY